MITDIAKKLSSGFVLATALVAGQAQAASFVGTWDPPFGNPFDTEGSVLGWEGSVEFYVPDACLSKTGQITNEAGESGPGYCTENDPLRLVSGVVRLYNIAQPSTILGTVTFAGPGNFGSVRVQGGTVTELTANFTEWESAVPSVSIAGGPTANYYLSFTGVCAQLTIRDTPSGSSSTTARTSNSDPCDPSDRDNSPFLTFARLGATTVPEPGSLALLLPAVGMLAAFRRRKPGRAAA